MNIVWSEPAEFDLDDLFDYIARDSPVYAEQFIDRIIDAVDKLADHPRIGRVVSEAGDDNVRELIVESYRLIYAIHDDAVTILAVVHGRRDIEHQATKPWE